MGKKKQIRNLKLEVETLSNQVIYYEKLIDELLSDTTAESLKKIIKTERDFAKSVDIAKDQDIIMGRKPDYTRVSKICDLIDQKFDKQHVSEISKDADKLINNLNIYNGKVPDPNVKPIQYPHKPVNSTEIIEKLINSNKGVENPSRDFQGLFDHMHKEHGLILTISEMHEIIRESQKVVYLINNKEEHQPFLNKDFGYDHMVTIQVPVGSFIVPPTDNLIIKKNIEQIENILNLQNSESLDGINSKGPFILVEDIGISPAGTMFTFNEEKKMYISLSENGCIGIDPKTMLEHWNKRRVGRLPNKERDDVITNPVEQEYILKNHKDILTYPYAKDLPGNGPGFVVPPMGNVKQTLEIERLKKENEEIRLNTKKSIDFFSQQLKVHIADKEEMESCIISLSQDYDDLHMENYRLKSIIEQLRNDVNKESMKRDTSKEEVGTIAHTDINIENLKTIGHFRIVENDLQYVRINNKTINDACWYLLWNNFNDPALEIPKIFSDAEMLKKWEDGIAKPVHMSKKEELVPRNYFDILSNSHKECKTSEKWLADIPSVYKVKITDPSGWDISNFEYSFKDQCISKKEFIDRLANSNTECDHGFFYSDWYLN